MAVITLVYGVLLFGCLTVHGSTIPTHPPKGDITEFYSGHKLIRIIPQDGQQVQLLMKLLVDPPPTLKELDFWNEPSMSMNTVDIRVDPKHLEDFELYLRQLGLPYSVIVPDLQSVIEASSAKNSVAKSFWRLSIYDSYLNYNEIVEWLKDAARRCGNRCNILNIGTSFENRKLLVFKITAPNTGERSSKPKIWVDAGIHAREWIGHSTALYFIDRLVSDFAFDSDVQDMLEDYDWYILPCLNPDGYQYTHDHNRLWRKTRSHSEKSSCVGVDANRNFDFYWGSVGSSDKPCTDLYKGPQPLSEPETRAVAHFIMSSNNTWKAFITLHSYGQKIMAPYGYTSNKPQNYQNLMEVANAAKRAVESVNGKVYSAGSASDILYRSSGTSRDWAAGYAKIPYVYTIELRDDGQYGFLLPSNQILPTATEIWEGMKAMIRQINAIDDLEEMKTVDLEDLIRHRAARMN